MTRAAVLLCSVVLLCGAAQVTPVFRDDAPPVRLAVFYETLCPDSQRWAKEQLAAVYPTLGYIMDVDINAYGKASDVPNADGGYNFTCQHGANECMGNMMLACAKHYITNVTQYIDFNICVMSSSDPPTAGEECATQLGLPITDIATCRDSVEGQQLLHELGLKQAALDPPVNYVPWMVYNDKHTDLIQEEAEYYLHIFVCRHYEGDKPAECALENWAANSPI